MRKTKLCEGLCISEYEDGILFGTDVILLCDFVRGGSKRTCADLGTGSGVIPLLLLKKGKCKSAVGVEIQQKYADSANFNAAENNLAEKFNAVAGDVGDIELIKSLGRFDFVTANPPYYTTDCGKASRTESKNCAFHETKGSIFDFVFAASLLLGDGKSFYVVWRPERMQELFDALRECNLTPKRLRPVCADFDKKPCVILVSAMKNGKPGLDFEKNFYIYRDKTHAEYSDEAKAAYGDFFAGGENK